MKYEIQRFEKPITKHYTQVKKYDVARFAYGDEDNVVNAIILDIKIESTENNNPILEIHFAYRDGEECTCYSSINDYNFEIVGKAKQITKNNDDELTK